MTSLRTIARRFAGRSVAAPPCRTRRVAFESLESRTMMAVGATPLAEPPLPAPESPPWTDELVRQLRNDRGCRLVMESPPVQAEVSAARVEAEPCLSDLASAIAWTPCEPPHGGTDAGTPRLADRDAAVEPSHQATLSSIRSARHQAGQDIPPVTGESIFGWHDIPPITGESIFGWHDIPPITGESIFGWHDIPPIAGENIFGWHDIPPITGESIFGRHDIPLITGETIFGWHDIPPVTGEQALRPTP